MSYRGISGIFVTTLGRTSGIAIGLVLGLAFGAMEAVAQGDGLTGTYYNWPGGTASPPPPPPGSPEPGATAWTVTTTRIDGTVNFADVNGAAWAPTGVGPNNFTVVWTGFVLTGTDSGTYTFYISTDDGSRLWVTNPMAAGGEVVNSWINQAPAPYNGTKTLLPNTFYPVRYEFFQTGGGTAAQLGWSSATMPQVIIPQANLFSAGNAGVCIAPTNLTATAGYNQAVLNWTAGAGATTYTILRGNTTGGPYTQVATGIAGTTYTDLTATFPGTYFYVVYGVNVRGNSPYSNEANCTPLQPPVQATPNTGLQTSEAGASTTFTIKFNAAAPAGGSRVTVTSSDITEGTVAANGLATTDVFNGGGQKIGFYFDVAAGATPTVTVTVTGVDDTLVDGNIAYQIDITATNVAVPIPPVKCTNIDDDVQGLVFSRTAGLVTTESGGQDSFSVTLTRQPFNNVSFTLTSSNTAEGTVVPGSLTFTNTTGAAYNPATGVGGWNVAHTVVVTGVDDPLLDFTVPYTIVTGTLTFADTNDQNAFTAAGVTSAPDVSCVNLDNEVPPALPHVWGSGCGLIGMEMVLPLLGALLFRRRRRT